MRHPYVFYSTDEKLYLYMNTQAGKRIFKKGQ